jgi:hypothetical protein
VEGGAVKDFTGQGHLIWLNIKHQSDPLFSGMLGEAYDLFAEKE